MGSNVFNLCLQLLNFLRKVSALFFLILFLCSLALISLLLLSKRLGVLVSLFGSGLLDGGLLLRLDFDTTTLLCCFDSLSENFSKTIKTLFKSCFLGFEFSSARWSNVCTSSLTASGSAYWCDCTSSPSAFQLAGSEVVGSGFGWVVVSAVEEV